MNYTASGNILIGGCAVVQIEFNRYSRFDIGEMVYDLKKARRGFLRKYCIKDLLYTNSSVPETSKCYTCNYPPLYVDTFNAYHNEEDVGTYDEAMSLIVIALQLQAFERERSARTCS